MDALPEVHSALTTTPALGITETNGLAAQINQITAGTGITNDLLHILYYIIQK